MKEKPAVRVTDLYKTFDNGGGPVPVLHHINFQIAAGEIVVVRGVSGSGKTTLLNILGGVDSDYSGEVQVGDARLHHLDAGALTRFRAEQVGFIYQFHNLIPTLTALENVLVGLEASAPLRAGDLQRAEQLLRQVGLETQVDKFPAQLSGGQQQRVAIARALVKRPGLILADEPTGSLDGFTGERVMETLMALHQTYRPVIVLVTHDPALDRLAHRVLEMQSGEVVERRVEQQQSPR